ncbi:hypothetical protein K488DRAFT_55106, partial [Vararia minispora EC-137]
EPIFAHLYIVLVGALLLVGIGIGLEVALSISNSNGGASHPSLVQAAFLLLHPAGFAVPERNILGGVVSPYLALSHGRARAEESIMLDYVSCSSTDRLNVFRTAIRLRHKLLIVSSVTVVASWFFQPLAGSVFSIQDMPQPSLSSVTSQRAIGLNPDFANLTAFESAAGYAASAVYNELQDPPFVFNSYSTAQFTFPRQQYLNGSMMVDTTAVVTNLDCSVPIAMNLDNTNPNNFTLTATSKEGCTLGPVSWNPADASQRYNVTNVPNCPALPESDVNFQPVFFWFWQSTSLVASGGRNNSAGVFCVPSLNLLDVQANASLSTGFLTGVTPVDDYPLANNVTGQPLQGRAFNGTVADANINTQARATAIRTGIPNAIFQRAEQDSRGLQAVFDDANGFLGNTLHVYTQHLALAATSVYFTPTDKSVPAVLTVLKPRLVIVKIPAHILAVLSFATGIAIIVMHVYHYRSRRDVYLPMEPGPIGLTIAQTSRSGFGNLLYPYDSWEQMRKKLEGVRFKLDMRTGAIVVDDGAVFDAGYAPGVEKDGIKEYNAVGESVGSRDSMHELGGPSAPQQAAGSPPSTAAAERMPLV